MIALALVFKKKTTMIIKSLDLPLLLDAQQHLLGSSLANSTFSSQVYNLMF